MKAAWSTGGKNTGMLGKGFQEIVELHDLMELASQMFSRVCGKGVVQCGRGDQTKFHPWSRRAGEGPGSSWQDVP